MHKFTHANIHGQMCIHIKNMCKHDFKIFILMSVYNYICFFSFSRAMLFCKSLQGQEAPSFVTLIFLSFFFSASPWVVARVRARG